MGWGCWAPTPQLVLEPLLLSCSGTSKAVPPDKAASSPAQSAQSYTCQWARKIAIFDICDALGKNMILLKVAIFGNTVQNAFHL